MDAVLGSVPVAYSRIESEMKPLKGYLPMKWGNNRFSKESVNKKFTNCRVTDSGGRSAVIDIFFPHSY